VGEKITRREWIGRSSAAVAALSLPALGQDASAAAIPTVRLVANGKRVPVLGLGGHTICTVPDEDEAFEVLRHLFRAGVRYVDTAPSYRRKDVYSEARIGRALEGFKREEFFLATKTQRRDEAGARRELEASLKRLRVDRVDAVQIHEIHDDHGALDPETGVLKALLRAREEKLLDAIGVTCHRHPRYLVAALERFDFALVLCPVNPIDPKHLSFIREALPVARRRKLDVVAMKVLAGGRLVSTSYRTESEVTAEECLRYALSIEGVAVAVPGIKSKAEADTALAACRGLERLPAARLEAVEKKTGPHRGKQSEWYKDA
jgi:predicted aldo/keto reductase-like oxidoreductase